MGWFAGFGVTLRQMGRKKVTEKYPKEKRRSRCASTAVTC